MNETIKDGTARATARRRLIRGAFAAPAVLTLYSGAAAAAQSVLCSVKLNNSPPTDVPRVESATDNYVRYRLYGTQDPLKYYVKTADFGTTASAEWQEFNINDNILGAVVSPSPDPEPALVEKYAVLRIDGSGAIVGVGEGTNGRAMGMSCWCSLDPTYPMCVP